jgi:hypothetical protein
MGRARSRLAERPIHSRTIDPIGLGQGGHRLAVPVALDALGALVGRESGRPAEAHTGCLGALGAARELGVETGKEFDRALGKIERDSVRRKSRINR